MRPGGGKSKGSDFERKVCNQLSRWIDPKGDDTHFWRSAISGGRATRASKQGKKISSQAGDICAVTGAGQAFCRKFTPECKHVKSLDLVTAAVSAKGALATFWAQVSRDAKIHGTEPLLIARQNNWPTLAFLTEQTGWLYFGALAAEELCRFMQFSTPVSMFFFRDLLAHPYREDRFK